MSRPAFRLAAVAIASGALVAALAAVGARAPQPPVRAGVAGSPITYFIADGSGRTGFRQGDLELARWALDAWRQSAAAGIQLEAAIESKALIRIYWAEPSGGEYGETRPLIVGGRRGAAVFIRPDMESLGEAIARRADRDPLLRDSIVYLTCVHELGHALGLAHTSDFRDIMYFFGYGGDIVQYFQRYRVQLRSRSDIANNSGLSEADGRRLKALYGSEP
jgi:hypothetical protein